jgi:hypothetical protein
VTILRRNVPVVCGASYHLLGYQILQDSKIRFQPQVKSYISDWLFSKSWLLASYVSRHKAMAYDSDNATLEKQFRKRSNRQNFCNSFSVQDLIKVQ